MARQTVTVRISPEVKDSLDAIASATNQDRSGVINDALNAYVALYGWQVDHIREGIRQADAGEFASDAKVKRVLSRLTGRRDDPVDEPGASRLGERSRVHRQRQSASG